MEAMVALRVSSARPILLVCPPIPVSSPVSGPVPGSAQRVAAQQWVAAQWVTETAEAAPLAEACVVSALSRPMKPAMLWHERGRLNSRWCV